MRLILRFFLRIITFGLFAIVLTYLIMMINIKMGTGPEKGFPISSEKKGVDFVLVVYTITLGFIGLFGMYNSLEIYKKKEQFDKEINNTLKEYSASTTSTYNIIKEKIDNNHQENKDKLQEKYETIISAIDSVLETQKKNIYEIERSIGEQKKELKCLKLEVSRNYYYYIITNSINNNLITKAEIIASLMWFSQHGNKNDINILERLESKIAPGDIETKEWCSKAVKDMRTRII